MLQFCKTLLRSEVLFKDRELFNKKPKISLRPLIKNRSVRGLQKSLRLQNLRINKT